MKERITITMDRDILKRIDKFIDGKKIRNRSHAVEALLSKSLNKSGIDTAFILAGGEGTRLRPLTYEMPKPMVPIHGRPILEHQINMLKKYDIRNIIISVGYMNEKIKEYFGNGSKFGVNIEYVVENEPLGTAGPIRLIKDIFNKSMLVLNVDTLINPDIPLIYDFHRSHKGCATIVLATVDDPSSSGSVRMKGSQIKEFIEKPNKGEAPSKLVNAGVVILDPEIIKFITKKKFMIEDVYNKILGKNLVFGYVHDGEFYDIGTPSRYERAIKEWKDLS